MRVFYDWEMVERGSQLPIVPVSGGFVREDGAELYVINEECLSLVLRHPWTSVNLVPSLPIQQDISGPNFVAQWDKGHPDYQYVMSMDAIVQTVRGFLTSTPDLELWGYYSDYDHVVLGQLFGTMAELPAGIPMWTHDLMQLIEKEPRVTLPPEPAVAHHAMLDAYWNRDVYDLLVPSTWAGIARKLSSGGGGGIS